MSISLNTTSAGTLVFCKIAMASSVWDAEAQVAILLSRYADETTDDGRKRLVRHGHLPEREIPDRHRSGRRALPAGRLQSGSIGSSVTCSIPCKGLTIIAWTQPFFRSTE
jgi:hypothetical protein